MADNCKDAQTGSACAGRSRWARRLPQAVLVIGLVLYSAVMVRVADSSFPPGVDDVRYLMLSRNILSGEGYVDNYKPLTTPHAKFPPILPLILALVQWFVPGGMIAMKLAVASFGLLSIIVFYLLFRRFVSDLLAALLAVTTGIQLEMLRFSQQLMSEVPYIFFSILTLFLIVRRVRSRHAGIWLEIAIGAAMSLATLTRTIGICLFAAFLAAVLLDRGLKKKVRCLCVVSLIFVSSLGAWEVRNLAAAGRFLPVYGVQLIYSQPRNGQQGLVGPGDLLRGCVRNINQHARHLTRVMLPSLGNVRWFMPLFVAFAAAGWLARFLRRRSVLEFYVAFYAVVLLLWPWTYDRFLLPIAGLLIFYFCQGFGLAAQWLRRALEGACLHSELKNMASATALSSSASSGIASASVVMLMLLISLHIPLALIFGDAARDRFNRPPAGFLEFLRAAEWIGEHVPDDAVVLTGRPFSTFLISGRKSFMPSDYQAEAMFRDAVNNRRLFVVQGARPNYVTASRPIARALQSTRGYWHVVFKTGSTYVIAQDGADVTQGQL